jgi:hypothetical protein
MSPIRTIEHMLRQLLKEMDYVQSQGAGYYTCAPFARRFNRLLAQTRATIHDGNPVVDSFEQLEESDPKDPADKSKKLLEIRIEITQLISFLETVAEEEPRP